MTGQSKGIRLCGKVKVVEHFADIKVQVVNSFPDLKVKVVDSFPDDIGEWQFVEYGEDFTVQFVDSFPVQGFPDWWCADLGTDNPSEEEMEFWRDVFETHRKVMGTSKKPKTDNQIRKWLRNPHTDSAEYRMWGNGCTLPIVFYALFGIDHFAKDT